MSPKQIESLTVIHLVCSNCFLFWYEFESSNKKKIKQILIHSTKATIIQCCSTYDVETAPPALKTISAFYPIPPSLSAGGWSDWVALWLIIICLTIYNMRQCQVEVQVLTFLKTKFLVLFWRWLTLTLVPKFSWHIQLFIYVWYLQHSGH